MTYAEKILIPFGYKFVAELGNPFKRQIVLSIGHLKLLFTCGCPAYPNIKALGCPLHHEGAGGSWPVIGAEKVVAIFKQ